MRGWDDPRMPTLSGIRRRGYTPEALRNFCGAIGVSKTNGIIELGLLEHYVREDLNRRAPRVMAVLRPLSVVIDNYPEGQVEEMDAVNNPEDASAGTRKVPFSRVLYIEQDDFREDPPKQYFRLSPGREVRLRYGYFITCTSVVKDDSRRGGGNPLHLRPGDARRQCARRPQGEVDHPLGLGRARHRCRSAALREPFHARKSERNRRGAGLHGQSESALAGGSDRLQSSSPRLREADPVDRYQFERLGYFCVDPDSAPGKLVFNRTVALRDTWAKIEKRQREMIILGIGGILGDAASAILKDGELVAAVEESKLVRRRMNWGGTDDLPEHAIATCLQLAGATAAQVDAVAVVRPIPNPDFYSKLRAQFPNSRYWLWSIIWRTRRRHTIPRPLKRRRY